MTDEFRQLPAAELDEDCEESWERLTEDPDIRGVGAQKITLDEQSPPWRAVLLECRGRGRRVPADGPA